jgi:hypothetical protein
METEATLWTIDSPVDFTAAHPESPAVSIELVTQNLVRLESVTSLAQLPAEAIAENLPEELVRWYRPWKKRYQESRSALARETAAAAKVSDAIDEQAVAGAFDRTMAAMDGRIGVGNHVLDPSMPDARRLLELDTESTRACYRGPANELVVRYARVPASTTWSRTLLGLATIASGAVAISLLRIRSLPKVAPSTALAALGTAWWLLLTPSVVGLGLLVAAIMLAWRSRVLPSRATFSR